MHIIFCPENPKGRDHLEDPGVDRKILECIPEKQGGRADRIHLAQADSREFDNELRGSTKVMDP
jgi:hypothetical protein